MTAVGALHAPYAAVRVLLLLSRLALTALVFLFLVRQPNCFGYGIFDLLPPAAMGAALPSANDVPVWLCGLGVLLTVAYYVPRFTLTLCVAAFTVAGHWQNNDYHAAHEDVLKRRLFVLGGAAIELPGRRAGVLRAGDRDAPQHRLRGADPARQFSGWPSTW